MVFPGKSFFSAHEVSTCKISGCLSYRILDSGPDGTQTTLTGKKTRQQCDDDEGIMIDSCVARMRKYKPEEYELIIAHFVIGISLRSIAKKRKCSDGSIRKQLQAAIGVIEGILLIIKPL
ncbi:antiterminator Q family protein [Escherichia coli]